VYAETVLPCRPLRRLATFAVALGVFANTQPRPQPTDYSVHQACAGATLAAEYFGRSAPGDGTAYFTGHYLVIEVAIYPQKGQRIAVRAADFRMVVNEAKAGIAPDTGAMAALDARAIAEQGNGLDVGVGPFVYRGTPRPGAQFPGDPSAPVPSNLPRAPAGERTSSAGETRTAELALPEFGLIDGEAAGPVSGYLYFLWEPNTKKIKTLELRWTPEPGAAPRSTLRLWSLPKKTSR
jgi:hypothetical protein